MKYLAIIIPVLCVICEVSAQIDPNSFAVTVVDYQPGSNPVNGFTNPAAALDRPSIDTSYSVPPTDSPVVPVFSAWQDTQAVKQLVSIGSGGQLVLEFGTDVEDDQNNPYGIDFIVFGNSFFSASTSWSNGDPSAITITTGSTSSEPGQVSVAQQLAGPWYTYTAGPFADGYAPTLGRIYDPTDPNSQLGPANLWWSNSTNPTKPLDPLLQSTDFAGKTVAQAAQLYGASAGGTGFDLAESGFAWIRYIRIENLNTPESALSPEIDAVANVDAGYCGDFWHPYPLGDLDQNCLVDLVDFSIMTNNWLTKTWMW